MSRSYKKHPFGGDSNNKFFKRYSNHKIRQYLKNLENCLDGSSFKKLFEVYYIKDYWNYWTEKDQEKFVEEWGREWDERERNQYRKWYRRK